MTATLIVYLPLESAGPDTPYSHVLASDRRPPASVASAPLALLPQPAR